MDHLDHEIARLRALSDDAIAAMGTLIDARDPGDLVRKLYRYVVALASPAAVLGRAFDREPTTLPDFCLDLATFRAYMERVARGTSPGQAAREVAHGRRVWQAREPCEDVGAEIDPGAVRAEIDRLLRDLRLASAAPR